MGIAQYMKMMPLLKRITVILLVACLGLAGIERVDADQPCEGILCGSGAANRHAARTGLLIGLAQLGQDLARAVTDRIYNSTILGEDWFWGGMAESYNRGVNEKFGDLVGEHNYIGPEEIPGLRAVGAEIFNNVAMEAATAGIVSGGPLAQRGLRALRGMPKWQRGAVDLAGITGGLRRTNSSMAGFGSADEMADTIPTMGATRSRSGGSSVGEAAGESTRIVRMQHQVFEGSSGKNYVIFKAEDAYVVQEQAWIRPGGNNTSDTLASIAPDGRVVVWEGKHRLYDTINRGDVVPSDLGGLPGSDGWLVYEINSNPVDWGKYYKKGFAPARVSAPNYAKEAMDAGRVGAFQGIKIGQPIKFH